MAPFGSAEDVERQSPSANNSSSRTSPAGSSSTSDATINRQAIAGSPNNRLTSLQHATPTLSPPALATPHGHQQPSAAVNSASIVASNQHSACTCEGARPIVPDPLTGQPVCACQLESSASAAATNLALLGLHPASGRPPALGGLYHAAYHHHGHHELPPPPPPPQFLASADQSPFYAAAANGELKDPLAFNGMAAAAAAAAAASGWPYPSMYYPYDPTGLAGYPFGGYGMDLNGSRRKNATRETTATLKAWLSEHKKNPYPTKGEKIMLAIITKMTLTQVSTWFANARRRLKKENKMTWEPKNRNDGDDDDDDDISSDPGDKDSNKRLDGAERWADAGNHLHHRLHHHHPDEARTDGEDNIDVMLDSDEEELDLLSSGGDSTCLSPAGGAASASTIATPASAIITSSATSATTTTATIKPKIWSLADMAGNQPSHHQHSASIQQQQQRDLAAAFPAGLPFGPLGQASAFGIRSAGAPPFLAPNNNNNNSPNAPGGGKMFTSFAPSSRLPGASPYLIDPSPYSRAPVPTSAAAAAAAAGLAYPRYLPPTQQQPASFASHQQQQQQQQRASNESVTLAYNQLMSSMAAHIQQQQQQQQNKASTNQGVLENLEKLAALASGASSSAKN